MARLNDMHIYGIVKEIKLAKDEDGNIKNARFYVNTMRRKSANPETEDIPKKDDILVFTKNKEAINIIAELKEGQCVEVFGQYTTRRVDSMIECSKCHEKITVKTYVAYIHPTGINTSVDKLLPQEQTKFIYETREKGNFASLMGTVINTPFPLNDQKIKTDEEGKEYFEPVDSEETVFSMSIPRAVVVEEDIERRIDYPLIMAKTLTEEENYIFKGAEVYVRGAINNRDVTRKIPCKNCGHKNSFEDQITLIFPYTLEFMFSNKNEHALGAAIEAINPENEIIIIDGEEIYEVENKESLAKEKNKELRKKLFPKIVKKITAKKRGKIEVEVE